MRRYWWIILLPMLILGACSFGNIPSTPTPTPLAPTPATGPKPPPAALQPVVGAWVLEEMPGASMPPEAAPTLLIGPSSFSGKAVCNHYRFQVEAREDGSWWFPVQEHTVIHCGEEGNAFERAYWRALMRAQKIQREGDALVFRDGSGNALLRFRKQSP